MRVLLSASTFPIRLGDGLPRFVYDLAQSLAAHCEVTVLAPDAPGAERRERMGDVEVRRFAYFAPRGWQQLAYGDGIGDNLRRSALARLQPPPYVACQALAVWRLVRERGIDVVNSHWILPQGLSSALARGSAPRFRHVVTLHGGDSYMLGKLPLGGALARFIADRSDSLIAVSSNVRDNLDAALGRPSHALLQPVGVHVEPFRRPAPPLRTRLAGRHLLFVGRLVPVKGASVLLRALPRVRARHPDIGLVIVGYGPLEDDLRALARELDLEPWVEFAGRRSHEEIAGALQSCAAAVVPSIVEPDGRAEGMPSVVLEALAAGARVVASAAGGVPDTLHAGVNGWLARPGDPADLADRILDALQEPPDSGLLDRASETARALDWSRVAARYLEVFEGSGRAERTRAPAS